MFERRRTAISMLKLLSPCRRGSPREFVWKRWPFLHQYTRDSAVVYVCLYSIKTWNSLGAPPERESFKLPFPHAPKVPAVLLSVFMLRVFRKLLSVRASCKAHWASQTHLSTSQPVYTLYLQTVIYTGYFVATKIARWHLRWRESYSRLIFLINTSIKDV